MSSLVNGSYLVGRKLDGGVRRVARSGHLVVAAVACTNTQLQCNGCGSLHQHIANPMGRVDSRAMQAARARQAAVPGSMRDPGPSRDRTFADDECVAFGVFELVLLKGAQSEVITAI